MYKGANKNETKKNQRKEAKSKQKEKHAIDSLFLFAFAFELDFFLFWRGFILNAFNKFHGNSMANIDQQYVYMCVFDSINLQR